MRVPRSGTHKPIAAEGLDRPKRVALLAYLAAATPQRFHRRDTLLWPVLARAPALAATARAARKARVGWFAALERGAAGRLHFHVLTAHTDHLESHALEKAWPCGRVDAARYDPARGAAYYLTKDIGESVDFSHDIAPPHKLIRVLPTLDPVGAAESGP